MGIVNDLVQQRVVDDLAQQRQREEQQQSKRAEPPQHFGAKSFEGRMVASSASLLGALLASDNIHQMTQSRDEYLDAWYDEELEEIIRDPELHDCVLRNVSRCDGYIRYLPV